MNHDNHQKGFTLIELILAMTFLSMLLLAIALTIVQISGIYNRGITVKEVNQAGTSLATQLGQSIAASSQFSISGASTKYIQQGNWGGRLCLGQYSYIWNYGTAINNDQAGSLNVYDTSNGDAPSTLIGLVKAYDPDGAYCTTPTKPVIPSTAVELVNVGQHSLAIHQLTISSAATAADPGTGEQLYTVSFTIGTNDAGTFLTTGGYVSGCSPPGTAGADPTYCVVQQFSLVARAGNTVD
jgi:prepilin-type N-terminal cleavage/methylation domain-containing protein